MHQVYSLCLASYWACSRYILSVWHPIGHAAGIFSLSGIVSVMHQVCALWLTSGLGVLQRLSCSGWKGTPRHPR
jgi:hypothetical protein